MRVQESKRYSVLETLKSPLVQQVAESDLASDVVSIKVEATDVLVDPGKGAEFLDGPFCRFQYLTLHTLRLPWNVLNLGGLQSLTILDQQDSISAPWLE